MGMGVDARQIWADYYSGAALIRGRLPAEGGRWSKGQHFIAEGRHSAEEAAADCGGGYDGGGTLDCTKSGPTSLIVLTGVDVPGGGQAQPEQVAQGKT